VVGKGGSVVRYGGEEFVVLLPGIGDAGMRECAESIRARIADSSLPIADTAQAMTISIGGATARPGQSISANALLKQADAAMYRAKHEGRNRIAIA
jgi:diguanylate cyclase